MEKEFEQVSIEFNSKAKKLFFSFYEKFKESAGDLNRQKDENVFQQQQGKYLRLLRQDLESLAKEIMYKTNLPGNINRLNKILTDDINAYMNEFRLHSGSL